MRRKRLGTLYALFALSALFNGIGCGSEASTRRIVEAGVGEAAVDAPADGPDGRVAEDAATQDASPELSAVDDGFDECIETVVTTQKPRVDLIIGLDLSGSVIGGPELQSISDAMNALTLAVDGSGVDVHVTLIAFACRFSFCPCIRPPLGRDGATCDDDDLDSNPPAFYRVSRDVTEDVLSWIVFEYDTYSEWLRDDATPVFLVFSDDDPQPRDFEDAILSADSFESALFERDPARFGSAVDRRYIFNSVVGTAPGTFGPSFERCEDATTLGGEYQELSRRSNGFVSSICSPTPSTMLDAIANGLVGRLACQVDTAEADLEGVTVDRSRVRLLYTPGDGSEQRPIEQVAGLADCTGRPDEFYAEGTSAVLCPSSCDAIRDDSAGELSLAFGCAPPLI
ncbi:MAG: hypothetical protein AAF411_23770 [Myxococcota bacterium]